MTVLFSDVAGSTALGERLDSEAVRDVMSGYYAAMRSAMERHGGVAGPLLGDGVMGVFGVPVAREDDAWRAVCAALELRQELHTLNEQLWTDLGTRLVTRTGVSTGEVLVGGYEFPAQVSGGVVGDSVNVAARLQTAAEPGEILLGELTFHLTRDRVRAERVELDLKGKSGPVVAYRFREVVTRDGERGRRLASAMVGRSEELGVALEAFEEVLSHEAAALVSVVADAGLGKTRLLRELRAQLCGRARILTGRCLPYGEGTTYWPFAEIACQAAGVSVGAPASQSIPALAELLGVDGEHSASALAARLVGFLGLGPVAGLSEEGPHDLAELMRALSHEQALVLLVEDVHFAQPALLDLLCALARQLSGAPVLIVCTSREAPDLRRAQVPVRALALHELSRGECEELVGQLLEQRRLDPELLERVSEASGGSPLVIEELLAMLIDDGALEKQDGAWRLAQPTAQLRTPPTIAAILQARLDLLPETQREAIECAAVIGRECLHRELEALSGLGGQLESAVNDLLGRQLLESDRGADRGYRFHHILVRDAAYSATPKRRRAELHERYAKQLEGSSTGDGGFHDEIVGAQFEHAWRLRRELGASASQWQTLGQRAAGKFGRAADRACDSSDFPAALALYKRGADLAIEDSALRAELLLGAAQTVHDLELYARPDTYAMCLEACAIAERAGARVTALSATIAVVMAEMSLGDLTGEEALARARACIAELESTGEDHRVLARAWMTVQDILHFASRDDDALSAGQRGLHHARLAQLPSLHYYLIGICGCAIDGSLPTDEALKMCNEALGQATPRTHHHAVLSLHRASLWALQGEFQLARTDVTRAIETFEARGELNFVAWGHQILAYCDLWADDLSASVAQSVTARELVGWDESWLAAYHAVALARLGRVEEAKEAAGIAERSGSAEYRIMARIARAIAFSREGDHALAEHEASQAIKLAGMTQSLVYQGDARLCLGEVLLAQERPDDAVSLVEEAIARFEQKGARPHAAAARRLLASPSRV